QVRIHVHDAPGTEVENQDSVLGRLEESPVAGLGGLERFFGSLALRNVADRAGDERAALRFERAEADLQRELGAVLPQAIKLKTAVRPLPPRRAEETRPLS